MSIAPTPEVPLYATRGSKFELYLRFGTILAADTSAWTGRLVMRRRQSDALADVVDAPLAWQTPDPDHPTDALGRFLLTGATTALLPRRRAVYFIEVTGPTGQPDRLLQGDLLIED